MKENSTVIHGKYGTETKNDKSGQPYSINNATRPYTLGNVVELTNYGKQYNIDNDKLRKQARDGSIPDTVLMFGKWVIIADTDVDTIRTIVDAHTGGSTSKRDDGRLKFTVYQTEEEHADYVAKFMAEHAMPEDTLLNPRKK